MDYLNKKKFSQTDNTKLIHDFNKNDSFFSGVKVEEDIKEKLKKQQGARETLNSSKKGKNLLIKVSLHGY